MHLTATHLEAALGPKKALIATKPFTHGDTIAILHPHDPRLSFVKIHTDNTGPVGVIDLIPRACQCGRIHIHIVATMPIGTNVLLIFRPLTESPRYLVQFDGSCHRKEKAGGAGIVVLLVTQHTITLLHWEALALPNCQDNVEAEARAWNRALVVLSKLLAHAQPHIQHADTGILQGDILPIVSYLKYQARSRRTNLLDTLTSSRQLFASMSTTVDPRYAPRERNKLADFFAGVASQAAKDAPLAAPTLIPTAAPIALLQQLGFELHVLPPSHSTHPGPHLCLTEQPNLHPDMNPFLTAYPRARRAYTNYVQQVASHGGTLVTTYHPTALDDEGRYYATSPSAQNLPKPLRLLLFGNTHAEVDITGAHYELIRRLTASQLPPTLDLRNSISDLLRPLWAPTSPDMNPIAKKWPVVAINADTPAL